jgi:hypothetical protein
MALTQVQYGMTDAGLQNTTYSFKNRIINGDMRIDQRNAGSPVTSSGTAFSCDRWRAYSSGTGTFTATQSTSTPNNYFKNSIGVVVTTTGTPSEAGFQQVIEGYNIADFGFGTSTAKSLTASFWVRSSVTGIYSFSLRQGSGAKSFVSPFNIATANTWQKIVVNIPGETTGTYNTTNGAGLIFEVCLGSNGLVTSTTDAWVSTNSVATPSQTNLLATAGATFYLTGATLEIGDTATSFDFRPYASELAMCQRYFQSYKGTPIMGGPLTANANRVGLPHFPVQMRISPIWTFYNMYGTSGYLTEFSSQISVAVASYSSSSSLGGGYVQTSTNFANAAELRFDASSEF